MLLFHPRCTLRVGNLDRKRANCSIALSAAVEPCGVRCVRLSHFLRVFSRIPFFLHSPQSPPYISFSAVVAPLRFLRCSEEAKVTPGVLAVLASPWRRCSLRLEHQGCRALLAYHYIYFVSFRLPSLLTSKFSPKQAAKIKQIVGMGQMDIVSC